LKTGRYKIIRSEKIIYTVVLFLTFIWWISIFVPPVASQSSLISKKAGAVVFIFFSHICHQQEERSFIINDVQLAVCSRCTGIYSGFFAGVILYPLLRRKINKRQRKLLIIGGSILLTEFIFSHLNIFNSSNLMRLLTGLLPGFITSNIFSNAIFDLNKKKG